MLRSILFLHRWLGIVVGLVMTIWCLSGFVMMYSPYPSLTSQEQLRGLAPLQLPPAQALQRAGPLPDTAISAARVEMAAGRPILRVTPSGPPQPPIAQMRATPSNIDLATGRPLETDTPGRAMAVAASFAQQFGISGSPRSAELVEKDQWVVQTSARHQPLHRVDFPEGETLYVAGTGEVVQQTTRAERILGWLGAVPHWLYPTVLRQNGPLWSQVVIWTSTVGIFLTVTGLWVGIARLKRNREGRIGSPFRGIWWWHHMSGLFFGLLTLTWVTSGLFTMNPWGFLDSMAGLEERERLVGEPVRWGEVSQALAQLDTLPEGTVRLEAAPLGGQLYLTAIRVDGSQTRLDPAGRPAPLSRGELVRALANGPPVASLELLRGEDSYYYSHKSPLTLPVWRAVLDDAEQTRLYIDPVSGRLLRAFDSNARASRWLRNGLHSLDFAFLRQRPVWDLVVVPLLALVTFLCGTGTWMGVQKLRRDARRNRNRKRRRKAEALRDPVEAAEATQA